MPRRAFAWLSSRATRIGQIMAVAALIVFSVWICLHYGRLGLMPLDQSIVFDGAWRIVSGQLPFRDFTTPAGLVPSAMQAVVFLVLGVNWFGYCLHAAIVNALFAVAALLIMRRLGASFWTAWLVGVGSAVLFYPQFGVPYLDQHSFFFSMCCLWTTLAATRSNEDVRWALLATPAIAGLAVLSKWVPAVFVVGPCVIIALAAGLRTHPWWAMAGIALPPAAALLYVAAVHVSPDDLVQYMWTLPLQTGAARTVLSPAQSTDAFVWARLRVVVREWSDLEFVSPPLVGGLGLAVCAIWFGRLLVQGAGRDWRVPMGILLLSWWLCLVTAIFVYVTANGATNGFAFLALIAGLAWLAFSATLDRLGARRIRSLRAVRAALGVLVLAALARDVWQFNRIVNVNRALQRFDYALPRWSPPAPLDFMILNDTSIAFDMRDILPYIASRPDNFLVFADSGYLYGATGHPSPFPALWVHPGLTLPLPGSKEFPAFEARVLEHLSTYRVHYVIEEGSHTFTGAKLEDFPRVNAIIAGCPERAVGWWTIREICR